MRFCAGLLRQGKVPGKVLGLCILFLSDREEPGQGPGKVPGKLLKLRGIGARTYSSFHELMN